MTSEVQDLKTNEFLRRRKLRIQQVREQSKDIAKKIRQRVKVEKIRNIVELDAKKEKEYYQHQDKLIKRLEDFYAKGLRSVGAGHRNASEVRLQDKKEKPDLSKLRGIEATAELRKKKQDKLDSQKKILDQKLQARETANNISREKSSTVAGKLLVKSTSKSSADTDCKTDKSKNALDNNAPNKTTDKGDVIDKPEVVTSDMATQWDFEAFPNEWEPHIPALSLPKDDNNSINKNSMNKNIDESRSVKAKRPDLFALSDEMPSSLRGGLLSVTEERALPKPSLTLISEYLQNRALRLRESDVPSTSKKQVEDLHSIKQTILRTRTTKAEAKGSNVNKSTKSSVAESVTSKRNVMMYNHSTRDTRDVPQSDKKLVIRDSLTEEDAYSQAIKESSCKDNKDKDHQRTLQDMRNKIAVTKQNVEKEYKDTMAFLSSLPKEKSKPIKNAYKDGQRQQMKKDIRQRKLQQEFRKIEKECRIPHFMNPKRRTNSKSPLQFVSGDDYSARDFQYSWMPVPDSDESLAIHTIPTTVKEGKSGNTVTFSTVDSYHEYRSRHKHTPPTKDTTGHEKQNKGKDTVVHNRNVDESTESSCIESDTSSVENLRVAKSHDDNSDADRIIIYKILDSKLDKKEKAKKNSKLIEDITKSLSSCGDKKIIHKSFNDDYNKREKIKQKMQRIPRSNKSAETRVSFGTLDEGVYKTVNEKGDNITTMYFTDNPSDGKDGEKQPATKTCSCGTIPGKDQRSDVGTNINWESTDDLPAGRIQRSNESCQCRNSNTTKPTESSNPFIHCSATTSTSSFKTASNDKSTVLQADSDFIKIVDDGSQEAGKFYIGASGLLKDDAYEVVIQLRKKNGGKNITAQQVAIKKIDLQPPNTESEIGITSARKTTDFGVNANPVGSSSNALITNDLSSRQENATVKEASQDPIAKVVSTSESSYYPGVSSAIVVTESFTPGHNAIVNKAPQNPKENISNNELWDNIPAEESVSYKKDLVDKAAHTASQSFVTIPSEVTKSDTILKKAASICTQTSLGSPNQRPVYIHMSSSTSTAYMSPPELVLPNYLRKHYKKIRDDLCYSTNSNQEDERILLTDHEEYCEEYAGCSCDRCTLAMKIHPKLSDVRTYNNTKSKLTTPPNTARNSVISDKESELNDYAHQKKVSEQKEISTKHKKKCSKCENRNGKSKMCSKNHISKTKRNGAPTKRLYKSLVMRANATKIASKINKNRVSNFHNGKEINKFVLKPVVKSYVDRLLALNKVGLKAIEVINQDCSSVTTPGSSIIEVPRNISEHKPVVERKISLEQIKKILTEKILNNYDWKQKNNDNQSTEINITENKNPRITRKKAVHKVKSLNISKHLFKTADRTPETMHYDKSSKYASSLPSGKGENGFKKKSISSIPTQFRGKCSSKSNKNKKNDDGENRCNNASSGLVHTNSTHVIQDGNKNTNQSSDSEVTSSFDKYKRRSESQQRIKSALPIHRATSSDSEASGMQICGTRDPSLSISTQTNRIIDNEIQFMKLAEDKIQNMEKIADLTEKCTKRLSNLAKVLEEVRKNKSLAYSQISDSASDSDRRSDKHIAYIKPTPSYDSLDKVRQESRTKSPPIQIVDFKEQATFVFSENTDNGVPGPNSISPCDTRTTTATYNMRSPENANIEIPKPKTRTKPPPALQRANLKHGQEFAAPHELSTVLEVESPLSVKLKNQAASYDITSKLPDVSNQALREEQLKINEDHENHYNNSTLKEQHVNPDLLQSNVNLSKRQTKLSSTDSSDDSKLQMMDLKQFNEIMLKPFISIQEYAKQCNVGALDEVSNLDDIPKDSVINDDLSSLHSDGSLPDVIAELLKRNIIKEPFKFDTASNINSTTLSSESTVSALALSKVRREKKKPTVKIQDKENATETSDTLSISSNPDLENAFKKLGMGWASSTLKKTKERLALSSSSNTSCSSLSRYKIKTFNAQANPVLVTDSSVLNVSNRPLQGIVHNKEQLDISKHVEQQTSLTNSMTVKQFLTNELAKKITFTNKSHRDETEEEFVSLYETKMPEISHTSQTTYDERSVGSDANGSNNRARTRTSTPVQIFKSTTYHSSSSSNGLFSNADLSSVKGTSNSMRNSTSEKDDLTIPNYSLRMRKGSSDCSKSD